MPTKAGELREASSEELYEKVEELESELFNLRFQKATGRLENYKRLREVKKEIARALSVLRERELGIEPRPKRAEPEARRRRRLFRRRPVVEEEALEEEEPEEEVEEDESEEKSEPSAKTEEEPEDAQEGDDEEVEKETREEHK